MTLCERGFPIPPGAVVDGENALVIEHAPRSRSTDDIRVGPITFDTVTLDLGAGADVKKTLRIRREVPTDGPVPDHRPSDWKTIFESIHAVPDAKVVILNHARDLHAGTCPFGPKLQNGATGENLEGWKLQANAMWHSIAGACNSGGAA